MAGLARQISCVDEVITAELDSGPVWDSSQRRFTKSLRGRQFDLAICLGPDCSFRLCQVCARSGARLRVGFSRPDPGDLFNFEIVCEDRHAFEGRQYEVMLSLLGLESGGKGGWSIPQDRASEVRCRYFSGEFGAGDVVAIDLSRREGKGMSRRQIDDMVRGLIEGGSMAILFFSLAEGKLVDYLKSTYGNRILDSRLRSPGFFRGGRAAGRLSRTDILQHRYSAFVDLSAGPDGCHLRRRFPALDQSRKRSGRGRSGQKRAGREHQRDPGSTRPSQKVAAAPVHPIAPETAAKSRM